MSERKDLIAICEMLGMPSDQDATNNKTDIELLRDILATLDDEVEQGGGSNKRVSTLLAHKTIPDSLAFPQQTRDKLQLAECTNLWEELRQFHHLLKPDYSCRRQMLLNRLDCTVESFKWKASNSNLGKNDKGDSKTKAGGDAARGQDNSEKKKSSPNELIQEKYDGVRVNLREEPNVTTSHLLALRETECDQIMNGIVSSKGFVKK